MRATVDELPSLRLNNPATRVRARARLIIVEFRGFSARSVSSEDVARLFAFCTGWLARSRLRGASQAPALSVTSSAHGCGRRTYTSRSRLRSFNRCAARDRRPRAERSAWRWTSTLDEKWCDLQRSQLSCFQHGRSTDYGLPKADRGSR